MLGVDSVSGSVPLWAAATLAALLVVACVLAFRRTGLSGSLAALPPVIAVVIAAWLAWSFADRSAVQQRIAERRALDARAGELVARAIAPGSSLACLDATAGERIENACEKSLFASPEVIAAGASYINAQLLLLSADLDYSSGADRSDERTALSGLRRALETDRFGFVAHVLAIRDGCTADQCAAFALLRDTKNVRANLTARTYENNVARYAAAWQEQKGAAVAVTTPPAPPPTPVVAAPQPSAIDFPTAASIPPVSIMNAEPGTTTGAAETKPPARPAAAPAARRPVPNAAIAPFQTTPLAPSASAANPPPSR